MIKQLEGTLVFVMCDRPVECYEKDKGQEWKAGIVITDEDTADEWDEMYPKQPAKKVKASQFEETYKCPVPEDAGKNVWVVTLKKNTKLGNGEPVPDLYRPHVFELQDGERVDVTMTKLTGNGSKGILTVDHWAGDKGNIARLKNVFVTEMKEYVRPEGSGYAPGDEVDLSGTKSSKPAAKEAKPAKAVKKVEKPVTKLADEENDDPF